MQLTLWHVYLNAETVSFCLKKKKEILKFGPDQLHLHRDKAGMPDGKGMPPCSALPLFLVPLGPRICEINHAPLWAYLLCFSPLHKSTAVLGNSVCYKLWWMIILTFNRDSEALFWLQAKGRHCSPDLLQIPMLGARHSQRTRQRQLGFHES